VKRKPPDRRQPVWLTPEAIAAAGRLTRVTGLSLHELVETALLGVDADELSRDLVTEDGGPNAPADRRPAPERRPARVIPLEDRRRRAQASRPAPNDRE
jgi:hypothetical protein